MLPNVSHHSEDRALGDTEERKSLLQSQRFLWMDIRVSMKIPDLIQCSDNLFIRPCILQSLKIGTPISLLFFGALGIECIHVPQHDRLDAPENVKTCRSWKLKRDTPTSLPYIFDGFRGHLDSYALRKEILGTLYQFGSCLDTLTQDVVSVHLLQFGS